MSSFLKIFIANEDGTIRRYDLCINKFESSDRKRFKIIHTATHKLHNDAVECLDIQHNYLVTGGVDHRIVLFDLSANTEIENFHHKSPVNSIKFSQDGRYIFAAFDGGELIAIRLQPFGIKKEWISPHTGKEVWKIAMHPNGKLAITTGNDLTIRTWNLITGEQVLTTYMNKDITTIDYVETFDWSPNGNYYTLYGGREMLIVCMTSGKILQEYVAQALIKNVCWVNNDYLMFGQQNGFVIYMGVREGVISEFECSLDYASKNPPTGEKTQQSNSIKQLIVYSGFVLILMADGLLSLWRFSRKRRSMDFLNYLDIYCMPTCMKVLGPNYPIDVDLPPHIKLLLTVKQEKVSKIDHCVIPPSVTKPPAAVIIMPIEAKQIEVKGINEVTKSVKPGTSEIVLPQNVDALLSCTDDTKASVKETIVDAIDVIEKKSLMSTRPAKMTIPVVIQKSRLICTRNMKRLQKSKIETIISSDEPPAVEIVPEKRSQKQCIDETDQFSDNIEIDIENENNMDAEKKIENTESVKEVPQKQSMTEINQLIELTAAVSENESRCNVTEKIADKALEGMPSMQDVGEPDCQSKGNAEIVIERKCCTDPKIKTASEMVFGNSRSSYESDHIKKVKNYRKLKIQRESIEKKSNGTDQTSIDGPAKVLCPENISHQHCSSLGKQLKQLKISNSATIAEKSKGANKLLSLPCDSTLVKLPKSVVQESLPINVNRPLSVANDSQLIQGTAANIQMAIEKQPHSTSETIEDMGTDSHSDCDDFQVAKKHKNGGQILLKANACAQLLQTSDLQCKNETTDNKRKLKVLLGKRRPIDDRRSRQQVNVGTDVKRTSKMCSSKSATVIAAQKISNRRKSLVITDSHLSIAEYSVTKDAAGNQSVVRRQACKLRSESVKNKEIGERMKLRIRRTKYDSDAEFDSPKRKRPKKNATRKCI